MWNLDDDGFYTRIGRFEMAWAVTWGCEYREKRERIRKAAAEADAFHSVPSEVKQWAFRIFVRKSGTRAFDIENVPKLIVDAFCERQIRKDKSQYSNLAFYKEDTIDYVTMIQVAGERVTGAESTVVEIFGKKKMPRLDTGARV